MNKSGFSLLETSVIIGLSAAIIAFSILVLKPARIFSEYRDSQKIAELNRLRSEIGAYLISHPDSDICSPDKNPGFPKIPQEFSYSCDTQFKTFKLGFKTLSRRFSAGGNDDWAATDGGTQQEIYETGTDLTLK